MKKSEESCEEPRDRLSELPDSLIFEIFGLLPMRAFVQTTVLSKRWKNLWTTTPYLDFNSYLDGYNSMYHSIEFINRALILWKGFKILKFKFSLGSIYPESLFSDIDVWVRLAKENGVEELYLNMNMENDIDEVYYYCVPHNLYLCSSLKVLSVSGCKLQIHGNVQWDQLRSLTIFGCIVDEHSINQVVSGSPQLEDLVLSLSDLNENLSIRSSSLKDLWISRLFEDDDEPSFLTELRIWSPNLETLHLGGVPYVEYSPMNVPSLTNLTLKFSCEISELGESFWQIFPALQHVEKLTLSNWCTKGLGDLKQKNLLSPLSNCKFLTLNESEVEYREIVDLLPIFPKLETLVLDTFYEPWHSSEREHATSFLQVERNLPESFLLQLRTVEITCLQDDDLIFPFIEFLLKHASKLQNMVIRIEQIKPPLMPWFWAQKLLRMQRSSPTAELILAEAKY